MFPVIRIAVMVTITPRAFPTAAIFRTIRTEYKNVMAGSTSPGHLLSRFERNIWSSVPPMINTKKNTIKKFILSSGSLKEIAALYGVSYPTVRLRLDRLIQKIQISETTEADPYVSLVKRLAVDDKLDFDTAKILITEYRKAKETE